MPKLSIKAGSTSETVDVFIQDATATDGSGKTGLLFNTSGLTTYYNTRRGASTQITLATLASATAAYSSGGFKEIDATNQKGIYRLDLPDTVLATGNGRYCKITIQGTGIVPCLLEIELTGWDNQVAITDPLASAVPGSYSSGTAGYVLGHPDKVGYSLSSTGLDSVSTTIPSGFASTFTGRINQIYNRLFGKAVKDVTGSPKTIKTYDPVSTSTVLTTSIILDDGLGNESQTVVT